MTPSPESFSSLSQLPESDPAVTYSDGPLKLALAGSAIAFAVAVAGCLIASDGYMPAGHLLYVSMLIGLLAGAAGMLAVGLFQMVGSAVQLARTTLAQRPSRGVLGRGGRLAMD